MKGGAVAMAAAGLVGFDRVLIRGPAADARALVPAVLDEGEPQDEVGPQHSVLAEERLLAVLCDRLGLRHVCRFS